MLECNIVYIANGYSGSDYVNSLQKVIQIVLKELKNCELCNI